MAVQVMGAFHSNAIYIAHQSNTIMHVDFLGCNLQAVSVGEVWELHPHAMFPNTTFS